jgi:hypothetical protein
MGSRPCRGLRRGPGVSRVSPRGSGYRRGMAKNNDQDAQRAAVREAKRDGVSPSEAGVTTGASKQREHVEHGKDRHEHSSAEGKSKT